MLDPDGTEVGYFATIEEARVSVEAAAREALA